MRILCIFSVTFSDSWENISMVLFHVEATEQQLSTLWWWREASILSCETSASSWSSRWRLTGNSIPCLKLINVKGNYHIQNYGFSKRPIQNKGQTKNETSSSPSLQVSRLLLPLTSWGGVRRKLLETITWWTKAITERRGHRPHFTAWNPLYCSVPRIVTQEGGKQRQ